MARFLKGLKDIVLGVLLIITVLFLLCLLVLERGLIPLRYLFSAGFREQRRQESRRRQAEILAERQRPIRTATRVSQAMAYIRSLPTITIGYVRSLHQYDDPDIAPYYKGNSRFFNEHYLSSMLTEEQLIAKLESLLRSDAIVGEQRHDHLLLVSGTQIDFSEYSVYRVTDDRFVVVEWWHHDWHARADDRCTNYRDDFGWRNRTPLSNT